MSQVRIGVVSWENKPGSFSEYLARAKTDIDELAGKGAELVLLPGFFEEKVEQRNWLAQHQEIADRTGLFLVFGPIKDTSGRLEGIIIDGKGKIIGRQQEIGIRSSGEITVFPSKLGNLALAIGKDVYIPEYSRVLAGMEADIVLAPLVEQQRRGGWRWELSGLWREVQQNQFWGAESGCGIRPGGVFGPCEATEDRTGILEKGWGPIQATLDERKRNEALETFPVHSQLSPLTVDNFLEQLSGGGR